MVNAAKPFIRWQMADGGWQMADGRSVISFCSMEDILYFCQFYPGMLAQLV